MEQAQRANFGSKIGIILATAGSAVGLGNVWRFPYMAGENAISALLTMPKPLTVWITINCGKF